jgi:hypothetical protein
MTTKEAMDHLRTALQVDREYAWGWHCNIAMAAVDEGMDRAAANRAAARFMKNCFGVDSYRPAEEWPDVVIDLSE